MRWSVEISSLAQPSTSQAPPAVYVLDAYSWQSALDTARARRGGSGPISDFSIEILPNGYRAVDPFARVQYVLRRAPDDAPLTASSTPPPVGEPARASNRPTVAPPPEQQSYGPGPTDRPTMAAPPPREPLTSISAPPPSMARRQSATTMVFTSPGSVLVEQALRGEGSADSYASEGAPQPVAYPNESPPSSHVSSGPSHVSSGPSHVSSGPSHASPPRPSVPPPARVSVPSLYGALPMAAYTGGTTDELAPQSEAEAMLLVKRMSPVEMPPPPLAAYGESPSDAGPLSSAALAAPLVPSVQLVSDGQNGSLLFAHAEVAPQVSSTMRPQMASMPPLPPFEIIFQRHHNPSVEIPLTYREYAYVVPEGVSQPSLERLLRLCFLDVINELSSVSLGKLVHLSVFNIRFADKPPRPPLVTLTWKDWRGPEPYICWLMSAAEPPSTERSAASGSLRPLSQGASPASSEDSSLHSAETSLVGSAPVAEAEMTVPLTAMPPVSQAGFSQAPAGVPEGGAVLQSSAPPWSASQGRPPQPSVPPVSGMQNDNVTSVPPMSGMQNDSVRSNPPPRSRRSSYPPGGKGRRLAGEDLLSDLFDSMHDLHFLQTSLGGADFVLSLALEKMPSRIGLCHFYDIDKREFVVVRAISPHAEQVLLTRTLEREALVRQVMRGRRRAVVVITTEGDTRFSAGRWALMGEPIRSVVVTRVILGGRFLGLLELANPLDGKAYLESDGEALAYIAEQFAEFLSQRPLLFDPDTVHAAHR